MEEVTELEVLIAGNPEERRAMQAELFDRYFKRLYWYLKSSGYDDYCAESGAADALLDLFRGAERDPPKVPVNIPGFLHTRATARAIDQARAMYRRSKSGVEVEYGGDPAVFELMATNQAAEFGADAAEFRDRVRTTLLVWIRSLEPPDLGIMLFMLNHKYGVLTDDEVAAFDSELIDCCQPHGIYSVQALAKRRTRLREQLKNVLKEIERDPQQG